MVSIIIPTYNRGYIIKKSIDSVLHQTYEDFELIIVDDGSTDGTKQLIDEYEDDRIKYYSYEHNKGVVYARNYGMKMAKGDCIVFQDSDDICIRLQYAGYQCILCHNSFIFHWGSQTFGRIKEKQSELMRINRNQFYNVIKV